MSALSWEIYLLAANTLLKLNTPQMLAFKLVCVIYLKKLYFYFYPEGKYHKYCTPYN